MENLKLYNNFINNIENNVLNIINNITRQYIDKLYDTKCVILYGNENVYLEIIAKLAIKKISGIQKDLGKIKKLSDNIYCSKFHYEIHNFNENISKFIISLISNKNINNESYIFLIKSINKKYEFMLKKLIDTENKANYIILSQCLSKLDKSIKSRSIIINCSFSFENIKKYIYDNTDNKIIIEKLSYTLLSTLINVDMKCEHNYVEEYIDNFLNKKKVTVNEIKKFIAKLYCLSIPNKIINNVILEKYKNKKFIHDIVELLASSCNTKECYDILNLERIFINIFIHC